jgi:hypothetical protein
MKKIDLGQGLGILANLGVIAGILLLVFELSQNRDMMRAQIRNELARSLPDFLSLVIDNREFADVMVQANEGEPLSDTDALRVNTYLELSFRYWENVHYQYRQDLYDESEFSRHKDTMAAVIDGSPSMYSYWCAERLLYSVPFMEFMDELLGGPSC